MGSGKRLFLYGYFGRRNTGDDAMLYAFLSVANIVNPRLTFYVLHGEDVPKVPDRAKESIAFVPSTPTAVLRGLLAADVFVIAGGTHITGYGLNRRTVAMRTRIALLIAFSKLLGKKVYLLGVGVDTFRKTLPRHVARWICTRADAISVRDATSYETSRDLGAGDKTVLGFDLAALLDWKNSEIEPGGESTRNHTLGFSITPVFTLYHLDEESDRTLVLRLGEALNTWMRKHPEWRVNLFVAHGQSNRNRNDDLQITRQLLEVLADRERVEIIGYDPNPAEMIAKVARCSAFVGMRYHACLFAYLSELPLLIIPYHPKCEALAREIGLPKDAVVPLDVVLGRELGARLESLTEPGTRMRATLPVSIARMRANAAIILPSEVSRG